MSSQISPAPLTTSELSQLGRALFDALETSYPNMPEQEQQLLRHSILDTTQRWDDLAMEFPTLVATISSEAKYLANQAPGGLVASLYAPSLIWALTQDWVPNQTSMVMLLLQKWQSTVSPEQRSWQVDVNHPIHLAQMLVLTMDTLPFELDPLVYYKVMNACKWGLSMDFMGNLDYHIACRWLTGLARLAERSGDTRETGKSTAYDDWQNITYAVCGMLNYMVLPPTRVMVFFDDILRSTMPTAWRLRSLKFMPPMCWLNEPHVLLLKSLLPRDTNARAESLPLFFVSTTPDDRTEATPHYLNVNHQLVQTYFPEMYLALAMLLPEDAWGAPSTLVNAIVQYSPKKHTNRKESADDAAVLMDVLG